MDTSGFLNAVALRHIRNAIQKYHEISLDVIVAVGPTAINFLATSPELFTNVPVVMIWQSSISFGFTGIPAAHGLYRTHRSGNAALLSRLHQLPPDSFVLYNSMSKLIVYAKPALPMVADASNAPVFIMTDSHLGHGVICGKVMNFQNQGRIAARLINELLAGKKPEELLITTAPNSYIFDWRELRRWHLNNTLVPSDSRVLFREMTFWEQGYRRILVAVLLAFALLLLFLYDRKRKQLRIARRERSELSGPIDKCARAGASSPCSRTP